MTTLQNNMAATGCISEPNISSPWRLPELLQELALERVRNVCFQLMQRRPELLTQPSSFSIGAAPASLLLVSAGRAFGIESYVSAAFELMDHAVSNMNHESQTFYGGMPGVLWCALNLDRVCETDEYESLAEDADEALFAVLAPESVWGGHFDIINGLAGLGVYVLDRRETSRFPKLAEALVGHLERLGSQDQHGTFWPTTRKMNVGPWKGGNEDSIVDIGMAHGLSLIHI